MPWTNAIFRNNLFLGTAYAFEFTTVAPSGILDWNPDAFVVGVRPGGEEAVRKLLKQSAALRLLPAVQKDRIVFVPNALLLSTSHHVVGAVQVIAKQLDTWGKP